MASSLPSANRPDSPLARPGPRQRVWISETAERVVKAVAARLRLTERIVLDAVLEDEALVRRKAADAASRLLRDQPDDDDDHQEPAASH